MEDTHQQLDQSDQQQITGNIKTTRKDIMGSTEVRVRFLSNTLERLTITIYNIGYQHEVFI